MVHIIDPIDRAVYNGAVRIGKGFAQDVKVGSVWISRTCFTITL